MRPKKGRRWTAVAACFAMVFASAVTVGTGVTAADPATAADPQDLAVSALQGWLRTADPKVLDDAVRQAHRTMKERASAAPDRPGSASVVFADGMTSADVSGFATDHGVNLYAVEVKVAVAATGDVHTMWFNDVARVPGTTAQKLDRSTGAARLRYFQQAEAAPSDQRAALRELAEGDYRVYRAEVVASNTRLAALVGEPAVRAVLPDPDDSKVTELRKAQQAVQELGAAVTSTEIRLESGTSATMRTDAPVVTNTGRDCYWKDAGVLACAAGDGVPVSGDRAVDAALPRTGAVAGSNESAPSENPVHAAADDVAFWTACNGTLFPEACPNDHTYRPHADTGGYEAFGVSIANYSRGTTIYICYAQWVEDNDPNGSGGHWVYSCYPYAVITADFTFGAARWDSRWGTRTTTVGNQNRYISTLAYKPAGLGTCVVEQFLATAECSRSVQNSVWVPNTGMEDELLIDNPACNPRLGLGRYGTAEDRDRGCFYPSYAVSTLPAPFLDTTFGDGQQYNLAVGSSSPASIAEGRTYSSYAEFWAYQQNDMTGKRAWHSVAVDSRVNDALICRTQGNVDPFCYFPVDSSRVSPVREFRPV